MRYVFCEWDVVKSHEAPNPITILANSFQSQRAEAKLNQRRHRMTIDIRQLYAEHGADRRAEVPILHQAQIGSGRNIRTTGK